MSKAKNRLVILFIAALFFIPVLAAMLMQSPWMAYEPEETTNYGSLIDPPVALNWEALSYHSAPGENPAARHWTLIYPIASRCEQRCIEDVTLLRQIHLASGRYRDKVAVVLLNLGPVLPMLEQQLLEVYPNFLIAGDSAGANRAALAAMGALPGDSGANPAATATTLIADPEGNVILSYPAGYNPSELNKDLKKLLKWSGR